VATSPRNPTHAPWLDLRAHKIGDPVERLRFLRREMQVLESEDGGRRRRGWIYAAAGVLTVVAAGWPTGTTQASVRETPVHSAALQTSPDADKFILAKAPAKVWQVDRSENLETYSNGLRIDLTFRVSNHPRGRYPVFPVTGGAEPVRYAAMPAGIVYHTTESQVAPFDEEQNQRLKKLGRNLLEVIRQLRSYHYIIDRFGRVYRVVEESDIANHSGFSVWADSGAVYVNLNSSFLAVAFEGQTGATEEVTAAQIAAGRMLTQMLRSRYSIAAVNCVTHAQVSVNPDNMHIGAHTDWASAFPFPALGLPDNYSSPVASLTAFGFEYDVAFLKVIGERWKGLEASDAQVAAGAAAEGVPVARYREMLRHRYKDILGTMKEWEERQEGGG
jgi:N-acetylmuramoyl-L-alanine amidase